MLSIENLNKTEKELKCTSVELCEIINEFRKLEEGKSELLHHHLLQKIDKELDTLERFGIVAETNFRSSAFKDKSGKMCRCYDLDKAGMLQILNSESAIVRYHCIQYLMELENYIKDSGQVEDFLFYRKENIIVRKSFTDILCSIFGTGDKRKDGFMYANWTNLVYRTLFGKSAKELKESMDLAKRESLRDNLTKEEIEKIGKLEHAIEGLLLVATEYKNIDKKDIYQFVKENITGGNG